MTNELYQQLILDHNAHPDHYGRLHNPSNTSEGNNPLCGDTIHLELNISENIIQEVAFEGSGCAISKASASLMTQHIQGKTIDEATDLSKKFINMVTSRGSAENLPSKLKSFEGVRQYPMRAKCATLPWHALENAIEKHQ